MTAAEGWYRDPFGLHQDRWFSVGWPTELIRDDKVEGRDPPPARDYDGAALTEIPDTAVNGEDLLHSDNPAVNPYDPREARWALRHYLGWSIGQGPAHRRTY
jgi:hypothetical protein